MNGDLRLCGSIPAHITPFAADFSIDELQFKRHIEWLTAANGTGGITCNGHAGEVVALSRDERRRVVALAAEAISGRVPLIAGVYAENYVQAIEFARDAKNESADALLIFPLNALAFGGRPDMVRRHFAEIAGAVGLPMVLFQFPLYTRLQYDAETLQMLLEEIPLIVAVKEWSLDIRVYEQTLRIIRSLGRYVSILTSFSTNLLPSLVAGADGILSGHGSLISDLQAAIFGAVRDNRLDIASTLYQRIQLLTASVYRPPMADMYTRIKEQLVMLGRIESAVSRPPLLPVSEDERRLLRKALIDAQMLE